MVELNMINIQSITNRANYYDDDRKNVSLLCLSSIKILAADLIIL